MSSSSPSMWPGLRRHRGRGRVPGWLDRGRRHPLLGHHRGPGDGLQRLVQGEAVPWAAESHRTGTKVHRHPQRPGHPDPCGWDRGGRHCSDQIWYETKDARLKHETYDVNDWLPSLKMHLDRNGWCLLLVIFRLLNVHSDLFFTLMQLYEKYF